MQSDRLSYGIYLPKNMKKGRLVIGTGRPFFMLSFFIPKEEKSFLRLFFGSLFRRGGSFHSGLFLYCGSGLLHCYGRLLWNNRSNGSRRLGILAGYCLLNGLHRYISRLNRGVH